MKRWLAPVSPWDLSMLVEYSTKCSLQIMIMMVLPQNLRWIILPTFNPKITVDRCEDKGYSVVNVHFKDCPKLLFDIVCMLTDMQYVVFHATISSDGPSASQDYYIRHMDGCVLDTEGEKERVIKCLEAAIRRRVNEWISSS